MESYFGGIKISRRLIVISMCVVLVFACVSPFSDFAIGVKTYFKSLGMSKAELREEVIRSFIHVRWRYIDEFVDGKQYYKLILIPKALSDEDIIQAVNKGDILNYLNEKPIHIKGKRDVDKLDSKFLSEDFTIAIYSDPGRNLALIPTKSIKQVNAEEFDAFYKNHASRKSSFKVSDQERVRGFGNNFFMIRFDININLACCDGEDDSKGKMVERGKQVSINAVKESQMSMLVVSNSGDILEREYDGTNFIHF